MASSVSGQDGAILSARDYLSCPARKHFPKSHMINPLLTKLVWSRWLDITRSIASNLTKRLRKEGRLVIYSYSSPTQ